MNDTFDLKIPQKTIKNVNTFRFCLYEFIIHTFPIDDIFDDIFSVLKLEIVFDYSS